MYEHLVSGPQDLLPNLTHSFQKCSDLFSNPVIGEDSSTNSLTCISPPKSILSNSASMGEEVCNEGQKAKKSIHFSEVTIYSFAREQGFSSVPDSGWCTLGMAKRHFNVSRLQVQQHCLLQRLKRKRKHLEKIENENFAFNGIRLKNKSKGRSRQANGHKVFCLGDSKRVPEFLAPPILSPQINEKYSFSHVFMPSEVHSTTPPCLSPPSPGRLCTIDDSVVIANSVLSIESLDTDSETSLDQMPSISHQMSRIRGKRRKKLMPIQPSARIKILKSSGNIFI